MSEPSAYPTPRLRFLQRDGRQVLQQWHEGTKGGERWEGWINVPLVIEYPHSTAEPAAGPYNRKNEW
jgi:hypothetical protein